MLLGGYSSCQGCGCVPATTGCPTRVFGGYDGFLGTTPPTPGGILGARVGPFNSSFSITSVTLLTDGLNYAINTSRPADDIYRQTPLLELWSHDPIYNSPKLLNMVGGGGVPDVLATFTAPSSFAAGNWVFTHAGYTVSASTYYWIVLSFNGRWAYWQENCDTAPGYGSYQACVNACCDYWTQGERQTNDTVFWTNVFLCEGFMLSIN